MIEILNQQSNRRVRLKTFRALLERLTLHYALMDSDITLAFVTDEAIQDLNRRFLDQDRPTDVLSFPLGEKGADGRYFLGDIIISVPRAVEQCRPKRHGLQRELELLTIHGFLHLQGFEHDTGLEEEEESIRNLLLEGYHGD
jgi:probable rRNA maturation factor